MQDEHINILPGELEWGPDEWIPAQDMARVCNLSHQWLMARIQENVLHAEHRGGQYYLSCTSVWRVQQIRQLERQFDADPHLAGLVTDLMEEVRQLRRQLRLHESSTETPPC